MITQVCSSDSCATCLLAGGQSEDGRSGQHPGEASVQMQCVREEHKHGGGDEYRQRRAEAAQLRPGDGETSQGQGEINTVSINRLA